MYKQFHGLVGWDVSTSAEETRSAAGKTSPSGVQIREIPGLRGQCRHVRVRYDALSPRYFGATTRRCIFVE